MNPYFQNSYRSSLIFSESGLESNEEIIFGIPSEYLISSIEDALFQFHTIKSEHDNISTADTFQYFNPPCDSPSKNHGSQLLKPDLKSKSHGRGIKKEKNYDEIMIEEVAEQEIMSDPGNSSMLSYDKVGVSDNASLPRITESAIKEIQFNCEFCTSQFSCKKHLINHVFTQHTKKPLYECHMCENVFRRKKCLIDHILSHNLSSKPKKNGSKSNSLKTTDRVVSTRLKHDPGNKIFERSSYFLPEEILDNVKPHTLTAYFGLEPKNSKRSFVSKKTKLPDTSFKTRKLTSGAGDSSNCFVCVYCGKQCKDSRGLQRHSSMHSDGQRLCCNTCGKQFYSRTRLKRHMSCHRDRNVSCEVCGIKVADYRALAHHRSSHHMVVTKNGKRNAKIFPCHSCDKVFSARSSQQIHMRVHTGERPYRCNYCVKAFADGGTLRKHERIHTGEKPYVCPICLKAFNQRVVLREHIKTHHTNVNAASAHHQCEVCQVIVDTPQDLCTHLVQHADESTAERRLPLEKPRKYRKWKKPLNDTCKKSKLQRSSSDETVSISSHLFPDGDDLTETSEFRIQSVEDEFDCHNMNVSHFVDVNDSSNWEAEAISVDSDCKTFAAHDGYQLLDSFSDKLPEFCSSIESDCDIKNPENSYLDLIESQEQTPSECSFNENEFDDCANKSKLWRSFKDRYNYSFDNDVYVHSGLGLGATVELQSEF